MKRVWGFPALGSKRTKRRCRCRGFLRGSRGKRLEGLIVGSLRSGSGWRTLLGVHGWLEERGHRYSDGEVYGAVLRLEVRGEVEILRGHGTTVVRLGGGGGRGVPTGRLRAKAA